VSATTIHTLLVRLGFDTRDLLTGETQSRYALDRLQATASKTAAAFVPASAAMDRFRVAIDRVGGSSGAAQALNNLVGATQTLTNSLVGTKPAIDQVVSRFAIVAKEVASLSHSGTALKSLTDAVQVVAQATNGSTTATRAWLTEMRNLAITNKLAGTNTEKFSLMVTESARHMQLAAGAATTWAGILNSQVKMAIANVIVEEQRRQALQERMIVTQTKMAIIDKLAAAEQRRIAGERSAAYNQWFIQQAKAIYLEQALARTRAEAVRQGNMAQTRLSSLGGQSPMLNMPADSESKLNRIGAAAEGATRKVGFLQRTLSMAFAFSGGVAVTTAMGFIGEAVLGFNSKIQQAKLAYDNFLGSGDKADAFIKKMEDFANVTPFDFESLNTATQRMIAMGFTAEEALPALRAMGDAVAGLGGGQDKLDRVAMAIGQIRTAGRVTSQDMRQLTEAGIPAWEMLATAIGKTQGETRKLAEKGLIPANQALAAILQGMETRYGGMMEKQARTALGAFLTLKDTIVQAIAGALKPAFDLMSAGLSALADFMLNGGGKLIAPMIWAIGTAIAVGVIPRMYGLAVSIVAVNFAYGKLMIPMIALIGTLTMIGVAWQENFGGIRDIAAPALAVLGALLQVVNDNATVLIPIVQVLSVMIGVRLVRSLVESAIAFFAQSMMAGAAAKGLVGYSDAAGVAALAGGRLAVANAAGIVSGGMLGRVLTSVATIAGGVTTAALGAVGIAIWLLVSQFDQVTQGLRAIAMLILGVELAIFRLLSAIPFIGDAFKSAVDSTEKEMKRLADEYGVVADKIKAAEAAQNGGGPGAMAASVYGDLDKGMAAFMTSLKEDSGQVMGATEDLVTQFGTTLQAVRDAAAEAGSAAMYDMANAIKSKQDAPVKAMYDLLTKMQNPLQAQTEIAQVYGMLTSSELVAGLSSNDPAVLAWAEALKINLIERLDEMTGGAYTAGANAAQAFNDAYKFVMETAPYLSPDAMERTAQSRVDQAAKAWNSTWKPSPSAIADGLAKTNAELAQMAAKTQGLSDLEGAFRDVLGAANDYFQKQHEQNLQLIQDQLDHRDAILEAKKALNQGPVDAAQRALDARRNQIQEWRMREAIRTASSPEAYRDAVLALQDYLAQQKIDAMQGEVDKAAAVIDKKKEALKAQAEADKEAENKRYEQQKRDLEYQLTLLQEYLSKHPGEWQNTEEKILALLKGYGFDYRKAGNWLGQSYVDGLNDKVKAAAAAAKALAEAGTGPLGITIEGPQATPFRPIGSQNPIPYASGAWSILKDNLLASLHMGEMVVPADVAPVLRSIGANRFDSVPNLGAAALGGGVGGGSVKTIIFQVGDEKLGEITDHAMYGQEMIYGGRGVRSIGGSSR
jgi:tape measure domain-containing protein